MQLAGNTNLLRTMRFALTTAYAVVSLTVAWHRAVKADEEVATMLAIIWVANGLWQETFVLALVVMNEDTRDVNAVRTRHTVFAVVAGYVLKTEDLVGNIGVQIIHLGIVERLQRTVTQKIVLQVLHVGHAAENGEHALWSAGIAESP